MLFNNGEDPKNVPQLLSQLLSYKQNTKSLGAYLTTELNLRLHIENLSQMPVHLLGKTDTFDTLIVYCFRQKIILRFSLMVPIWTH